MMRRSKRLIVVPNEEHADAHRSSRSLPHDSYRRSPRGPAPMTAHAYEVVAASISDESEAPKGQGIYYRCTTCGGVIPSQPDDNVGCECGNLFIDIDYFRLAVRDLSKFEAVRRREA